MEPEEEDQDHTRCMSPTHEDKIPFPVNHEDPTRTFNHLFLFAKCTGKSLLIQINIYFLPEQFVQGITLISEDVVLTLKEFKIEWGKVNVCMMNPNTKQVY